MQRLFLFALLFLTIAALNDAAAQTAPAGVDAAQRQQALHALQTMRGQLAASPSAMKTARALASADAAVSGGEGTAEDTGGIAGYVNVMDNRADSSGAWVLIVGAHLLENPTAWRLVGVNADGAYVANDLNPGIYFVMAGAPGYQPQFFREAYHIEEAEPVPVDPEHMTEGIDFFLSPMLSGSGSIAGTVQGRDIDGPVAGAEVYAYSVDNPYRAYAASPGSDGTYRFQNVAAGRYLVEASAPEYFHQYYDGAATRDKATPVPVGDGEEVTGIDFTLTLSGSISGRITDTDGQPLPHADILVQHVISNDPDSMYAEPIYWASADENGAYKVSGLREGRYLVMAQSYARWFTVFAWYDGAARIEDATPVAVEDGRDTPGIDIALDLSQDTGRIAGRVTTADGEPAANAFLRLEPYDGQPFHVYAYVDSDADGNYVFEDIPVGRYRVALDFWNDVFYTSIWYDGVYTPEDASPVEVTADATTEGIDFTLPRADGVLEGTVTDADGQPIANAYVYATAGSNVYPVDYGFGYAYGMTDADGAYRIQGLIDGEYLVSASACMLYECVERWWPNATSPADAEKVVLADGVSNPPAVDFSLPITRGTASLSGSVVHADGQALANAFVALSWRDDATRPGDAVWYAELQTYTDSSGMYRFDYLPAGNYIVNASYWNEGGHAIQWYDGADTPERATPVPLADGEARDGIDFRLDVKPIYGTLAGKVYFDDGEAASRAYVEVSPYYWDYAAWPIDPVPFHTVTDDGGGFEVAGLPAGTYFVNVYAQGGQPLEATGPDGASPYVVEIAGGATTEIEVPLMRLEQGSGRIEGTVAGMVAGSVPGGAAEAADSALHIAIVQAMVDDDPHRTYTAIADENGAYAFDSLPEGTYTLWSFAPYHALIYYDGVYDPAEATRIDVDANTALSGVDFLLQPVYYRGIPDADAPVAGTSSYLFGQVVDETGAPIDGASVYALDDAGNVLQSARTHADGMYEIAGMTAGAAMRLKAAHPGYASRYHDGARTHDAAESLHLSSGRYQIDFTLAASTSVGIGEPDPALPSGITLRGNYPNPFNPETQIAFSLSETMPVTVAIFDALGRQVTELFHGALSAGDHQLRWDATGAAGEALPSGLYFYRVAGPSAVQTGKMTLLR